MKLVIVLLTLLCLVVVEGSHKVSKRHLEIIDSLAGLPRRKRVRGVTLELDAQEKFREEGLAALNGSTIRTFLRASAVKQGIPKRSNVVTEAHLKILEEIATGICGEEELLEIEEAGEKLRTPLKNREEDEGGRLDFGETRAKDSIAKRRACGKVARKIFQLRGLEDVGRSTIYRYLKLAREKLTNAASPESISSSARGERQVVKNLCFESSQTADIFSAAHGEVLANLVCSSSDDTAEDLFKLATEEFKRRNLVPLSYSSFLRHYSGRSVKEKTVIFSDAHRDIMLGFIQKLAAYTEDEEEELLFNEVSQEFDKRGLKKVSKNTFMDHLKRLLSDEEDAVGGLLLLTGTRL